MCLATKKIKHWGKSQFFLLLAICCSVSWSVLKPFFFVCHKPGLKYTHLCTHAYIQAHTFLPRTLADLCCVSFFLLNKEADALRFFYSGHMSSTIMTSLVATSLPSTPVIFVSHEYICLFLPEIRVNYLCTLSRLITPPSRFHPDILYLRQVKNCM